MPGGALPSLVVTGATDACPGTSDCLCKGVELRFAAAMSATVLAWSVRAVEPALDSNLSPPAPPIIIRQWDLSSCKGSGQLGYWLRNQP